MSTQNVDNTSFFIIFSVIKNKIWLLIIKLIPIYMHPVTLNLCFYATCALNIVITRTTILLTCKRTHNRCTMDKKQSPKIKYTLHDIFMPHFSIYSSYTCCFRNQQGYSKNLCSTVYLFSIYSMSNIANVYFISQHKWLYVLQFDLTVTLADKLRWIIP